MKFTNKLTTLSAIASSFLLTSSLLGATPPSSDDILRQVEPLKLQKEESIIPEIKAPTYKAPMVKSDIKIGVKSFKITENKTFSEAELLLLLKEYENKELTFNELNDAAAIITKYYKERGYFVARGYVPVQELAKTDAIVEISVIEGIYGEFTLVNNSLVKEETIQGFLNQLGGQTISTPSLERTMLLLDNLGGAKVSNAEIFTGKTVGTTDFGIETQSEPKYYGYTIADNYGSRYTGEYRLNVTGYVNSLTNRGDLLGVSILGSNTGDLKNGRISYVEPLGYSGWNLNSSLAYSEYAIAKEFENLGIKGDSTTFDIGVSYPIIKSKAQTINASATYTFKTATDEGNTQPDDKKKKINSVKFGLDNTQKTSLGGAMGTFESSLSLTAGNVNLNDYSKSIDSIKAEGGYTKLNFSLSQNQSLIQDLSLGAKLNGQIAIDRNLDGGEDFSAGGANGVRAYTDSELSGDKGYLASLELTYRLPTFDGINHSLSTFVDHARVWDNINDVAGVATHTRLLSASGLGYNLSYKDFSLKASYAHGFGADKTPTGDGKDTNLNRAFVQAMMRF